MLSRVSRWPLFPLLVFPLLISSCSSLFYYPSRQLYYPPKRLGYEDPQEIPFKAKDGTQLFAWYFPVHGNQKPKGTLIQFHGNAENISSHYLSLIWLVEQGYELFIFDYRGYGKSDGKPNQAGTYLDALAALDQAWTLHEKSGSKHFIVVAQSLGGAIAMRAISDFPEKSKVDLIVMDSTFISYRGIAKKKLASFWLTWPISWLGGILVSNEYSAEKSLEENRVPLLVIHDKNDPIVPYSCSEDFYPKAHEPREFWTLDQGEHVGAFTDPRSPYRERFIRFLDSLP